MLRFTVILFTKIKVNLCQQFVSNPKPTGQLKHKMVNCRVVTIEYDSYRVEGTEVIIFGSEDNRPIHYALDIKDWQKLKSELIVARLGGSIKFQIDNNTSRIIQVITK